MRVEYDPQHDVLNLEFISDEPIVDSLELNGIIIDYTKDNRIVSIEVLDAGKRTIKNPLDILDLKIVKEDTITLS